MIETEVTNENIMMKQLPEMSQGEKMVKLTQYL